MGKRKFTIEEMQSLAIQRGGKCLSTHYVNSETPLFWQCAEGHTWSAIAASIIQQNSWCPECGRLRGAQKRKLGIAEMHAMAAERGGKCLSTEYKDSKTHLTWQCANGHTWSAMPNSIRNGHWCLECANDWKRRNTSSLTIDHMRQLAAKQGGECLSEQYDNVNSTLQWRCALGHEWETKAANIIAGHWCPDCAVGLSERICRAIFEYTFDTMFPKMRPSWLLTERGDRLELDGYAEELGIAFEYHGKQHYMEVRKFKLGADRLLQLQARDERKRLRCIEHQVLLIEVPYTVSHADMQAFILAQVDAWNQTMTDHPEKQVHVIRRDVLDINRLSIRVPDTLNELRAIAGSKGGECLSPMYLGRDTYLRWRCAAGHVWQATPHNIKHGHWCRECSNAKRGVAQRTSFAKIQAAARKKGGKCLSSEIDYQNVTSRLRFRCRNGHEWVSTWDSVRKGSWCRKCASRDRQHKS